jgi:predicted metal-binding protein
MKVSLGEFLKPTPRTMVSYSSVVHRTCEESMQGNEGRPRSAALLLSIVKNRCQNPVAYQAVSEAWKWTRAPQ